MPQRRACPRLTPIHCRLGLPTHCALATSQMAVCPLLSLSLSYDTRGLPHARSRATAEGSRTGGPDARHTWWQRPLPWPCDCRPPRSLRTAEQPPIFTRNRRGETD